MTFHKICRALVLPVAMLFLLTAGPLPAAHAAMVTTDQVVSNAETENARERLASFLNRSDVREQMRELGVDPEEADARVAAMSDAEVARIADKLDEAKAGQGVIGPIVGAAVFIFVVLLVTDLLCLTSVFDFTRCAR